MVINSLIRDDILKYTKGALASGKESKVYLALNKNHDLLAVKVYLTISTEFKKRLQYIAGDPRFSNVKKSSYNLISIWTKEKFKNLHTVYANSVASNDGIYRS